jgi:xanthine/CO dehydrogenase XdhC/CoxF family maturation factor/CTP:molybdopterin cytidylyltransferase MocA
MDGSLQQLLPMYERARAAQDPLVLATVIATRGSTYRKAGAQMLIGRGGRYEGILSGGCLEGDLAAHAASVLDTGTPKMVRYDNRGDDDLLWGLGAGCEGGMDVWLVRLDPAANWEPFATLARCFERREGARYAFVLDSAAPAPPVGTTLWIAGAPAPPAGLPEQLTTWLAAPARSAVAATTSGIVEFTSPRLRLFLASTAIAREVLLIGGGPDALPVVELGATLGWRMTVADHRPAYADKVRFPRARRVLLATPAQLAQHLDLTHFDAAVVMSHHIATDLAALEVMAATPIPYVGLLGPASRRKRLLADLGPATAARFGARLHAPVGLELGGRDPASIALAITAEIQAHLHGKRHGQALDRNTAASSLHVMLLAAGSSSRFGSPKQLADIAGRPMLARTLDTVLQLERRHPVTVVLGADVERLAPLVRAASASVAFNPDHAQGIASSIRVGLAQAPFDARGVLIALADQVAVTADDLRRLVSRWEQQPDRIVAALYDDTIGVPAIFPADLFPELAELQGDRGARALLSRYPERVFGVPMPSAAQDIDTPGDLPGNTTS